MKVNQKITDIWLLILRLGAGSAMLTHGWPKMQKLLEGGEISFGDPLGLGPVVSLILAVFAEFICSVLICIGLWTRLATIPVIITMVVAALIVHGDDPFAQKEKAVLYLLVFLSILVFGGGRYSADAFRK